MQDCRVWPPPTPHDIGRLSARQILEMGDNLEVLMSEERVAVLCKEVDEWTARKAEEDSMEVGGRIAQQRRHTDKQTNRMKKK